MSPDRMDEGARISIGALYIYPIKSCAGISVQSSAVTRRGLAFDRRFMIVDENRQFLTQREQPRLALVKTQIDARRLMITTPIGATSIDIAPSNASDASSATNASSAIAARDERVPVPVVVWKDEVPAMPCEPHASELLSDFLGARVTLVYMPEDTERMVDPRYASPTDIVSFADGFAVLVASRASLDAVNDRLVEKIGMDRFRPNVVLEGTRAFEEDDHPGFTAQNVSLSLVKPCSRCMIVNIDQETAESKKEVLAALATFRARENKTYFAVNALVANEGTLAVSDEVTWRA